MASSPQDSPPEAGARLGEVVVASTTGFTAQCHRLYEAPPLGSLVKCGSDLTVYGVVADVYTQSIDPSRHPTAMGESDDTEEAVYQRNPQLSRLLSTEFKAISVGYEQDGHVYRYLAPLPPRIHSFVYVCTGAELSDFTGSLDFLPVLLASAIGSPDDVVASFLRLASQAQPEPEGFLVRAGKELAPSLGGEFHRLNRILRRLSS